MVHGGGFYLAEKYAVAPERMPDELHWFKYEAYFTWITGFLLLVVVYYFGADAFLIDQREAATRSGLGDRASRPGRWPQAGSSTTRSVESLHRAEDGAAGPRAVLEITAFTFFYHAIFSDRAAFLHVGAMIGTIMAASVFFIIIPNQKNVVADLHGRAGSRTRALGKQAAQRSLHNNYLTLPVIFMMISNHYPMMFGHPWSPFIALGIVVGGGLIRHFFNITNHGVLTGPRLSPRSRRPSSSSSCSSSSPLIGPGAAPRRAAMSHLPTFIRS